MPLKNFFFRNLKWLFFCHFAKLPCILPFFEIECYCYCFEFDFSSTENSGWVERARKLSQDVGPPNSASQQLLDENPKHSKSVWWKIKENLKSELLFEHREIKIDNFFFGLNRLTSARSFRRRLVTFEDKHDLKKIHGEISSDYYYWSPDTFDGVRNTLFHIHKDSQQNYHLKLVKKNIKKSIGFLISSSIPAVALVPNNNWRKNGSVPLGSVAKV